jgi:hypothetical protein
LGYKKRGLGIGGKWNGFGEKCGNMVKTIIKHEITNVFKTGLQFNTKHT